MTPPASPRQEIIDQIKAFQHTLGVEDTENFTRYSESPRAVYRCYFTEKLRLPPSYRGLRFTESRDARCSVDQEKYDVFFYPIEAVASGAAPVTPALAEAPLERVLVVVPHEDFHDQAEAREPSPEISEAAATLIGFLTATEFARDKYGAASPAFQSLSHEARLFLQKARIVNLYYDKLSDLYSSFRSRKITRQAALVRKGELFADLQRECGAITPDPVSFNKCPAAMNNAGLAFDRTYSRHYQIMFDLYLLLDHDAKATILNMRRLLMAWPESATAAADLIEAIARRRLEPPRRSPSPPERGEEGWGEGASVFERKELR